MELIGIYKTERRFIPVKYLKAMCNVRHWEDGKINGEPDEDGSKTPCKNGDCWCPLINLETGIIENWTKGVTADIHYKVCDAGFYKILDADKGEIHSIDGYVPSIMSPEGDGYGDYVIMKIDSNGKIENWKINLQEFEDYE